MRGNDEQDPGYTPGADTSYETDTLSFGAGESFDAIFTAPAFSGGSGSSGLGYDTYVLYNRRYALADNVPAQPEFDGGGVMTSLTKTAAGSGGSVTYSFVANHPGTFIYESGTDSVKQVNMGLFGVLIVYPTGVVDPAPLIPGVKYMYDRADTAYTPEEEFLVLLSEIDPYLLQAV
jgi:hypothetical protein